MVTNHNKIVESVNAHLNEVNHTLRQEGFEQLMVMNHNKRVASVNENLTEVKPRPTPIRIYVEDCNSSQQHYYLSHHKTYVEETHVHETTAFFYLMIRKHFGATVMQWRTTQEWGPLITTFLKSSKLIFSVWYRTR